MILSLQAREVPGGQGSKAIILSGGTAKDGERAAAGEGGGSRAQVPAGLRPRRVSFPRPNTASVRSITPYPEPSVVYLTSRLLVTPMQHQAHAFI